MARYAIYDNSVFVNEVTLDELPVLPGKPYREFYTVEVVSPNFSPATQVYSGPTIEADHPNKVHRKVFSVRNKTAGELDADKELKLDAIDMLNFEVNFDQENRIRALEGKTSITKLQYRNALKARL